MSILKWSRWSAEWHRPWVWCNGRTWRSLSSWDQLQGSRRHPACGEYNLSSFEMQSTGAQYQIPNWFHGCHEWGEYQNSVLNTKYLIFQVAMCQYHTLGQPCRSTCVKHHRSFLNLFFLTILRPFPSLFKATQAHLCCDFHRLESCLCPWLSDLLYLNSKSLHLETLVCWGNNQCLLILRDGRHSSKNLMPWAGCAEDHFCSWVVQAVLQACRGVGGTQGNCIKRNTSQLDEYQNTC